jgi:hypothetical protein
MAGWLEEVQRDPRTLGAFRRRIESLLRDPAVARRVAGRLDRLQEEGRASAPEAETPDEVYRSLSPPAAAAAPLRGRALACVASREGTSIFGRCDCEGGCCLMVPNLRPMQVKAPPRLSGGTEWMVRH